MGTQPTEEWPPMVETEWDDDGVAVEGTDPIAVVSLGAWGKHNEPTPSVEAAGCSYCDRWAVDFYAATRSTVDGPLNKRVTRRMEVTLIYVCDQHRDMASHELLATFGYAMNDLALDLVTKVAESRRAHARQA